MAPKGMKDFMRGEGNSWIEISHEFLRPGLGSNV